MYVSNMWTFGQYICQFYKTLVYLVVIQSNYCVNNACHRCQAEVVYTVLS